MQIEYQIVPHKGDWAISIDGVVYDNVEAFKAAFPLHEHNSTKFVSEFEFSWWDIRDDIVLQWEG